jgi:hypothetical protein
VQVTPSERVAGYVREELEAQLEGLSGHAASAALRLG